MTDKEIYAIYGTEYRLMTCKLLGEAGLAQMIQPGQKVGIKPNLVAPVPAVFGATTHPEIVAGIIEYLKANGINDICIIEGSWVGDSTMDAYEYCGFRSLCEKYGVPFKDTQTDSFSSRSCEGMDINICDSALDIDFLINVPVLKGHGQTLMTCALKNMKGLIPNTEKRLFHKNGLHGPIAHLNAGLHQDFIVTDHICGDLTTEDGGNPVTRNCIMCGTDPVLMDSYGAHLMGIDASDVEYIGLSEKLGVGSADLTDCSISTWECVDLDKNEIMQAKCTRSNALDLNPREPLGTHIDKLKDIKKAVEEVESCSSCTAALMPALMRLDEEGLLDAVIEKLGGTICIGQGYRQTKGKFGVGSCCSGFDEYIKGCPPKQNEIYERLKALV